MGWNTRPPHTHSLHFFGSFPFLPSPILLGAYYLSHPDAGVISLLNDLTYNNTCSVTWGRIRYWRHKRKRSVSFYILLIYDKLFSTGNIIWAQGWNQFSEVRLLPKVLQKMFFDSFFNCSRIKFEAFITLCFFFLCKTFVWQFFSRTFFNILIIKVSVVYTLSKLIDLPIVREQFVWR